MNRLSTEIGCLYCPMVLDSKVTISETVFLVHKHLAEKHPQKQIRQKH